MANVRTLEKNNKGFCLDSDFKDLEITHRNQELLRKIHSPNMDDKTLKKQNKTKKQVHVKHRYGGALTRFSSVTRLKIMP